MSKSSGTVRGDVDVKHIRRTQETDEQNAAADVLHSVWDDLPIHPETLHSMRHSFHMSHATECQVESIPTLRNPGTSVIIEAHTGSGKTLAFLIPTVERILTFNRQYEEAHPGKPYRTTLLHAIVISPYRALCRQTYLVGRQLVSTLPFGIKCILHAPTGSRGKIPQIEDAGQRGGGSILFTTPTDALEILPDVTSVGVSPFLIVVDECDVTLDKFSKPFDDMVSQLKSKINADVFDFGLFGATAMQSPSVQSFHGKVTNTKWIIRQLDDDGACTAQLSNRYVTFLGTELAARVSHLVHIMNLHRTKRHIVFFNQSDMADMVCGLLRFFSELRILSFDVEGLQVVHGHMSEGQRMNRYKKFLNFPADKGGAALLCTNLAAHGLDIRDVEYVIHFDVPDSMRTYCHRVGRTARMGMKGTNIVMLACESSLDEHKKLIEEMCEVLQIVEWKVHNVLPLEMSPDVVISKRPRE